MLDQPMESHDRNLSNHILSLYSLPQDRLEQEIIDMEENNQLNIIDKETLAQYISFAR